MIEHRLRVDGNWNQNHYEPLPLFTVHGDSMDSILLGSVSNISESPAYHYNAQMINLKKSADVLLEQHLNNN